MKILVTGGTGFIGRAVAAHLHERGHDLRLLVRGPDAETRAATLGLPGSVVQGSLEDADALERAVEGVDAVVHLAALVSPALQGDESTVRRVNCDAAVRLGELARRARVRRLVFTSSIAAMGFFSGLATSDGECRPVSSYGRAKLDAERALLHLATPSFDVVVLRPPTVYGPGEPYNFLTWVRSIDRGLFRIIGRGDNAFPMVTTENVARAVLAGAGGQIPGGVYLVADAEPYSVARIHAAVLRALGKKRPRLGLPRSLAFALSLLNEAATAVVPRVPSVLTRARLRTLTVDQRFDLRPLLDAGIPLDAPLEQWVLSTVADYRRRGLL